MSSRARIAALVCLAVALAGPAASAQTSVEAEIARGVALRRDGRDQAALEVFQSVWSSSRAPRALAQVALAEQALGRWVEAEGHLVEALGGSVDPWIRTRLPVLQAALAEIRRHVGRLDVSGGPAGAEVVVEGRVVGTLPLPRPLRVRTGSLTFSVRRGGYVPVTRTVQVEAAYPSRETVALEAIPAPPVVAPPPQVLVPRRVAQPARRTRTSGVRYAGFALIGTGAAALVVSGVFLGLNLGAASDAESATPTSAEPFGAWARFEAGGGNRSGDGRCSSAQQATGADAAQVRDLCARISTSATVALAAGIGGGVLLVTGVVMAAAGRDREELATARWSVSPWLAQGAGGAVLRGAW